MFLDQSAAFDCVRHEILLRKIFKKNFDDNAKRWLKSYLEFRTEYIEIGGDKSRMEKVEQGVSQGSVLGPLLYSIFTNELPYRIKDDHCRNQSHNNKDNLFGQSCANCGTVSCFADDTTFVTANLTIGENARTMKEKLSKISNFLINNKLTINQGKTKIQESMVKQKRCKNKDKPPQLPIVTRGTGGQSHQKQTEHKAIRAKFAK